MLQSGGGCDIIRVVVSISFREESVCLLVPVVRVGKRRKSHKEKEINTKTKPPVVASTGIFVFAMYFASSECFRS